MGINPNTLIRRNINKGRHDAIGDFNTQRENTTGSKYTRTKHCRKQIHKNGTLQEANKQGKLCAKQIHNKTQGSNAHL